MIDSQAGREEGVSTFYMCASMGRGYNAVEIFQK